MPDELHLLMRITDILLRNIINDARSKDDFAKITGGHTDNLSMLVNSVQSCGVCFKVWQSKTGELEWTSLTGNDKKKVLRLLPEKMLFCLHEDTSERVISLWDEFSDIYQLITEKGKTDYDELAVHAQIQTFMRNFLRLGELKREGYSPSNITPYLHVLLFHVPMFLGKHGSISIFSGQAVEKTNDILKSIHQSKTNKLDPTADALLTRKRQELAHMHGVARQKRPYSKINENYWSCGISKLRKEKARQIRTEQIESDSRYKTRNGIEAYENMTVNELKLVIKELGIKTNLRKKEKLIELVLNHRR